jgi:hypothetical protein
MMRLKAATAMMVASLMLGAVPAHAVPLWRDIEPGMTLEQVRALYPVEQSEGRKVEHNKHNTELHGFMTMGKCKPRVEIWHPEGKVVGIKIWMRKQSILKPTCLQEARLAVFEKFGSPDMDNTRRSILPAYADLAQESLTWIEPRMTVEWLSGSDLQEWSIEYRTAPTSAADQL